MTRLSFRSLAASLLIIQSVFATAIPQAPKVPATVIPGPGLPSLAALGLTQKELFDPNFLASKNITLPAAGGKAPSGTSRAVQAYSPSCSYNTGTAGSRSNAIACRNYLIQLGSAYCDIPAGASSSLLCSAGDTEIIGWNYFNLGGAVVADCSDTAVGAGWVIDNCSEGQSDYSFVEGTQSTPNNDYYVVYVGLYNGRRF